jgi:hypothetical protein
MNERMARLWAEAEVIGRGGLAIVSRATGLALNTVKRGRNELRDGAKASRHVPRKMSARRIDALLERLAEEFAPRDHETRHRIDPGPTPRPTRGPRGEKYPISVVMFSGRFLAIMIIDMIAVAALRMVIEVATRVSEWTAARATPVHFARRCLRFSCARRASHEVRRRRHLPLLSRW